MTNPFDVGRRLRELRQARGLSQRGLAGELDGCSGAYISMIESGRSQASQAMLDRIARRLGTTSRYLATGELEPWQEALAELGLALEDLADFERELLDVALEEGARIAGRQAGRRILAGRLDDWAGAHA